MATTKKRYKHTSAKQVGGDDGYCWTVFVHGVPKVNSLTRREVGYYRDKFECVEEAKLALAKDQKQN